MDRKGNMKNSLIKNQKEEGSRHRFGVDLPSPL